MAKPVLVVDANREFGILIRQSLHEKGQYKATLVHRGQEALEAAQEENFDLALVDLGLPDLPGPDLVRQLQQIDPHLSIVAISAAGRSEELTGVDVAGVISKPFYLPDLPQMLEEALSQHRLQVDSAQEQPADAAEQAEPEVDQEAAAVGGQRETSEQPLAHPTVHPDELPRDLLERATDKVDALGGLFWDGKQSVASAGLTSNQLASTVSALRNMGGQIETSRVVTQYVRLPEQPDDLLLFASPWGEGFSLVTIYPSDHSFRQARRGNQEMALFLRSELASTDQAGSQPPVDSQRDLELSADQPTDALPEDWVPATEFNPAQRAMLQELASIEPPPAKPADDQSEEAVVSEQAELPKDWLPSDNPPRAVLAMLDESPQPSPSPIPADHGPGEKASDDLAYSLILIPRFPEHRFQREDAPRIQRWVQRICLTWDWRAERLRLTPDLLHLRLRLNPSSAPAQAVRRLKTSLGELILREKSEWRADLPSGRFFAQDHLLVSGPPPDTARIKQFIESTRRSQGLRS